LKIQFAPLTEQLTPAIREFNRRIETSGATPLCDSPAACWMPNDAAHPIFEEHYLAVDGENVRGGYILRHTPAAMNGEPFRLSCFGQPTSEGIVDKRFGLVSIQILQDAEKRQPCLFGVGLGGWDEPVTKMLKAARWTVKEVPFFLKLLRPVRLLRTAPAIRTTGWRGAAADVAAMSGLGWIGLKAVNAVRTRNAQWRRSVVAEMVPEFGRWADHVWDQARGDYSLIAARDGATLNTLYKKGDPRFLRLRITERSRTLGWAVVMDSQLKDHDRFGTVRAGLIVDVLGPVKEAGKIMAAAAAYLERRGVDLVRSHQSHPQWGAALQQAGFFAGPSYFLFAASRAMTAELERVDPRHERIHFTRGDGDGPQYL